MTSTINQPPKPQHRRWISLGIVAFLLSQIIIPSLYYFSDAPTCERFAWRMFSSIHMSQWDSKIVAVIEEGDKTVEQTIPLETVLQETYIKTINSAQLDIVEPYMRQIATRDDVREVRFEANGTFPSGKKMEPMRWSLKSGEPMKQLRETR